MTDGSDWLAVFRPVSRPRLVIYGIGHAGSGAAPWREVAAGLPADVELRAIRLAGREKRIQQPPALTVEQQVDDLAMPMSCSIEDLGSVPYVLVGVCSGAITAFELSRRLGDEAAPARLVVASQMAPDALASDVDGLHLLPSPQLRALLGRRGDLPPLVAEDQDMFEVFESFLRADCEAIDSYIYAPAPPLACAVSAIVARRDEYLDRRAVFGWGAVTTGSFSVAVCDGGHNLLVTNPAQLAAGLTEVVADIGR